MNQLDTPFELLYERQVRVPLQIMKENWEEQDANVKKSALSFILETRASLEKLHKMASSIYC